MEKLCVFCKHFSFENGGYGEYAVPTHASCSKKHYGPGHGSWGGVCDEDDLRKILIRAQDCPDYSPPSQEK